MSTFLCPATGHRLHSGEPLLRNPNPAFSIAYPTLPRQTGIQSGVAELFITVCSAVAKCWAKNKRDVFLSHLMGAIESCRDYDLEDIQVLGMFVPIAGSRPVYELVNMTEEEKAIAKAIEKARENGTDLTSAVVPLRTPTPYRLV